MSYSKNTGYDPVSSGDARSRGGSVEMKAVNRSALSSSTQQHLAETSEVEHLNGNDDGTPNMSEAHGLDLQRVILCYFGVLGFVTLAILYGAMLGIVVGTNSLLQSDIKVELNQQVESQAYATLNEAGDYLVRVLESYDQSVLTMTDYTCRNVFRSDFNTPLNGFPTDSTSLYYDLWNGDTPATVNLKAPLTPSARFKGKKVSLGASAGFVKGEKQSDVAGFNANLKNTLLKTSFLDEDFIHMWNQNPQVLQIYIGFGSTSPASLRRYPGRPVYTEAAEVSSAEAVKALAYDPPLRPWYIDAMATKTKTVYTAPYPDFHGLGWMITGARAVYDRLETTSMTTPIGVVGIDLLMEDIAEVLNGIKFLSTGKLSLFHGNDGQVVTDIELDYATATKEMYYNELKSPAISKTVWGAIRATSTGGSKKLTIDPDGKLLDQFELDKNSDSNTYIFVKHLSQYAGQYYLVVFVAAKEILAPVTPALDKMASSNVTTSVVLMISLFVSMIFLLGMMMYMMRSIIKVFNILQENVEKLLRNVGTANGLGDGMVEVHESASNELSELQNSMNVMIHNMQTTNDTVSALSNAGGDGAGAVTGQQQLEALWNIMPMETNLDASAPPYAEAYVVND